MEEQRDYTWEINSLQEQVDSLTVEKSNLQSQLSLALEELNEARWQVSTLSGSLSICQNWKDVSYEACIEERSSLQEQLVNITNYSDSLSSQLQECLVDGSVQENRVCDEEGENCELNVFSWSCDYSLFWNENDHMYSLPVANHVFLPRWLKAFINSWSVSVSQMESEKLEYHIDEGSYWVINEWLIFFFKSVVVMLFVALLMYSLKWLLTWKLRYKK